MQLQQIIKKSVAFTLIELMVVIAIVGVIMALAIPSYSTYIIRSKIATVAPIMDNLVTRAETYYAVYGVWPTSNELGIGDHDGYGGTNYNIAAISPYLVVDTGQVSGISVNNDDGFLPTSGCHYTIVGAIFDGHVLAHNKVIFDSSNGFTNQGDPDMLYWNYYIWDDGNGVINKMCGSFGSTQNDYTYLPAACQQELQNIAPC